MSLEALCAFQASSEVIIVNPRIHTHPAFVIGKYDDHGFWIFLAIPSIYFVNKGVQFPVELLYSFNMICIPIRKISRVNPLIENTGIALVIVCRKKCIAISIDFGRRENNHHFGYIKRALFREFSQVSSILRWHRI